MSDYYYLGINFGSHDASVSLYKDGVVLFAAEEERFNLDKHTKKFPAQSLKYAIEKYDLDRASVKVRAVYFINPYLCFLSLFSMLKYYPSLNAVAYALKKSIKRYREWLFFKKVCKENGWEYYFVNHHLAHAASAYFLSPYKRATILTIDGRGECSSTSIYHALGNKITRLREIRIPFSLGYYYSAITEHLGFRAQSDEFKVMGLSSYGRPAFLNSLKELFVYLGRGKFFVNINVFDFWGLERRESELSQILFEKREPGGAIGKEHEDLAASVQKHVEEIVLYLAKEAVELTKERQLCLAGGVALNCLCNSRVAESSAVEGVFVPPAANDAGASLGAALYLASINDDIHDEILWSPFLGPEDDDYEIQRVLNNNVDKIVFSFFERPQEEAARLLSIGMVVGWFNGKMEWGPRALGNRSILAPANPSEMKDKINVSVKHREKFRPFAPMVLKEDVNTFFEVNQKCENLHKYMLGICKVRDGVKDIIPAVTHVDGTARIQVICRKSHEDMWKLITSYKDLTGVGCIINTSFNVRGRPMVVDAQAAIDALLDSELDACFLGSYKVVKK